MARRQQRQFNRSSSRPNRTWAGVSPAAYTVLAGSTKVLLNTFVLSNQGIDETILRVVGQVSVSSDQQAVSEDQIGAIGMCIVTDTAVATGITAVPDPVTDVNDDIWFMYQSFSQQMRFGTSVGLHPDWATNYQIDSKAKRIVQSGETIIVVAANAHASHSLQIAFSIRVLGQVRGTR